MMKKLFYTLPVVAVLVILGAIIYAGHYKEAKAPAVAENQTEIPTELGDGNIKPLDQFTSTSSPTTAITQRTFGKALRITGLNSCDTIDTDANGYFSCGTDASGGGGGGSGNVSTSTGETAGQLAYWTSTNATPALLGKVATSSLAVGASLLTSGTLGAQVGGTNSSLSINTANANTWSVLQTFNYSSSTAYSSFLNASTTNLFLGTGQGSLYVGSGQAVKVVATSTPTVTSPITYSGTLGSFLGGSSGTFACATCAVTGTTLTIAGTANQITSSAGAQDLSASRTWTLSFPNQVIFPQYASTTLGFSTPYASSTALHIGTGQGIAFVGSNGKVGVTATSTFALSQFTNDLANLTALDTSLTFSGSYNGATARTVGLNTGRTNTWTVLQNFNYSSSTAYSSFQVASTTQLNVGSGQGYGYIGSNGLFGVISSSTLATNMQLNCATITGSASLCDGDDATGGGAGSFSTSTADYIIYKKGASVVVYDTLTNTDTLTTTTFGSACNFVINNATSTFPARNKIEVRGGYMNAGSDCIIDGNSSQYSPTFIFNFHASSTEIFVASGINAFRFQNQARVNITDLTCGVVGTATCLFATTTSGTQSSLRESYFKGLNVHATTTYTGWAVDLINPFRNHFESVDLRFVANGVREQCNTSGFNCGDTTYERGFTEILNSGIGYMVQMIGNAGTHNQNTFIDWNGISNDTNDVMWYFKKSNWNRVLGSNAEEFATSTEFYNSNSNTFISNKYMNLGNSGGTVMYNDANSYNNSYSCKYIEATSAVVLMRDLNTVATTRANSIGNFEGGYCTLGDDGGSVTLATTTSSVVYKIHDNITGNLSYLNGLQLQGDRIHFNWNNAFTTFIGWVGGALNFQVGGNSIMSMTSTVVTALQSWDFGGATSVEIPNGTGNTTDAIGEIAFDTSDNQLLIATTTQNTPAVIPTTMKLWGMTIASTSVDFVSGGRIWLPPQRDGFDVTEIHCAVDGGTSVVIGLSNSGGTTDSETVTCDADGQTDTSIDTNSVYTAGSLNSLEIGTVTGSVDYVTVSIWGKYTRE